MPSLLPEPYLGAIEAPTSSVGESTRRAERCEELWYDPWNSRDDILFVSSSVRSLA